MKKEKPLDSDYMGGIGNVGHLWEFIDYFAKKLDAETTPNKKNDWIAYLHCPNFAAWLRFYSELICNKAINELHRFEKCKKEIKSYGFAPAIETLIKYLEEKIASNEITVQQDEFLKMITAMKKTVDLRHTIQHGGIPNILREITFKADVSEEDIISMMNPTKYKETKIIFDDANKLIELLPRPTIVAYEDGHIEFREPKRT